MASMRDIKRRRDSIQSTGQITKAMKLVSTVKLQKAKGKAESTKPYSDLMYETICNMLARSGNINHKYLQAGESERKAVITITANRGLAGGYNTNITDDCSDVINEPLYTDARDICDKLLERFADGQIGEIYLAYTSFKNTVVHEPKLIKLLPVSVDTESVSADKEDTTPMNYEPAEDEALNLIIPKYVCSLIYGALIEAVASENGARMQAMDNATSNADEMISDLSLKYNRARQASITQELTEIIAGANAIG